ncbi:MAG: hypothetical protein EOP50_06310 [Sphingobacteriales bacterium]|nr:MAG: hypothetical protein EOP50_06310 [Sphingobacteriales bacterium]
MGKRLVIENGGPKGEPYTDPGGKKYFKAIFWTRIFNGTDTPLEYSIDFPADAYELASSPGTYFTILLPPDTMTRAKEPLYNYGLTRLTSFLDSNMHAPPSLKRTINPNDSGGFFVLLLRPLATEAPGGILRTALRLSGQNLFYRIARYDNTPAHALLYEKEIPCGRINLKGLVFRE